MEERIPERQLLGAGTQQEAVAFRPIAEGAEFCHRRERFRSGVSRNQPSQLTPRLLGQLS